MAKAKVESATPIGTPVLVNIGTQYEAPAMRPGIVVADWGNGCVNVQVTLDGTNDFENVVNRYLQQSGCASRGDAATKDILTKIELDARHACSLGLLWFTSINKGSGLYQWSDLGAS